MPHIALTPRAGRRPEVPEAWLGATASANDYTGKRTSIRGFKVRLAPGLAPESQTAQWDPRSREIEIDANVMLPSVSPEAVDFNDVIFRERHPLVVGALLHETSHAAYSTWTPFSLDQTIKSLRADGWLGDDDKFTRPMLDVLVALEEHTCEWKLAEASVGVKKYLPAIVFDLLAREFKIGDSAYSASIVLALILARHDAGTLGKGDVKPFRDAVATLLDDEQIEALLGLAREYREHEQTSSDDYPAEARVEAVRTMRSIATRWLDVLGIDPEADEDDERIILALPIPGTAGDPDEGDGTGKGEGKGETGDEGKAAGGDGSDDGAEGDPTKGGSSDVDKDAEVDDTEGPFVVLVNDAAAEAKGVEWIKASERLGDAKVKRELEERAAESERKRTTEGEREKAYRAVHGYTDTKFGDYATRLHWIDPTPAERAAATSLGRELQRIVATEPIITETKMNRPGKRVLGRGMVARRAQEAQGRIATADYWKGRHRAMPDTPPVTVGVLMDVSGSMSAAADPLASASYILANAVAGIDGRYAAVAFGGEATGIVRPGQHISKKPFIYPHDGTEAFKAGFLALDGALDLVAGEGVRILVMLSDGVFVNGRDAEYANLTLGRVLPKAGVVALHLDVDGSCDRYMRSSYDVRHGNPRPIVDVAGKSPLDVARIIGRTVREEVAKAARVG
jgi:hypothetical protein